MVRIDGAWRRKAFGAAIYRKKPSVPSLKSEKCAGIFGVGETAGFRRLRFSASRTAGF
jgi:hypothetical protein